MVLVAAYVIVMAPVLGVELAMFLFEAVTLWHLVGAVVYLLAGLALMCYTVWILQPVKKRWLLVLLLHIPIYTLWLPAAVCVVSAVCMVSAIAIMATRKSQ